MAAKMRRLNPYAEPGPVSRMELTDRLLIAVRVLRRDPKRRHEVGLIRRTLMRDGAQNFTPKGRR
jgi:hypothetical protein